MVDCTLVTCEIVPDLDPDDRLLMHELQRRGLTVSAQVWNDDRVEWAQSRLCVVRSTWDYHRNYSAFIAWIGRVSSASNLCNPPELLYWNAHKSYLIDLQRLGVPVVPTVWLERGATCHLDGLRGNRGWRDVVLKPARGAASHNVTLVRHVRNEVRDGQALLDRLLRNEDVLVQPYLERVETYGERALMFFAGSYSHAVRKKPFDRVLTVNDAPSSLVAATDEEIEVANATLAALDRPPVYARVDLLRDDENRVVVGEVELIEPGLYLAVHEPSCGALADAIERELQFHG